MTLSPGLVTGSTVGPLSVWRAGRPLCEQEAKMAEDGDKVHPSEGHPVTFVLLQPNSPFQL